MLFFFFFLVGLGFKKLCSQSSTNNFILSSNKMKIYIIQVVWPRNLMVKTRQQDVFKNTNRLHNIIIGMIMQSRFLSHKFCGLHFPQ